MTKKKVKYIINAGGWYVGNSAVLEWLDKFPNVCYVRGDLDILRDYGGVYDFIYEIEENNNKKKAYFDILTYTTKKMLDVIKYRVSNYTKYLFSKKKYKFINLDRKILFYIRLYKSIFKLLFIDDNNYIIYWRKWLINEAVLNNKSKRCDFILLQNPFYYEEFEPKHVKIWKRFFPDRKLIFLFRNHLDQYKTIKDNDQLRHTKNTRFRLGTESLNQEERFFYLNQKLYDARKNLLLNPKEKILVLNFEDFAKQSCNMLIKEFIGLDYDFNPDFDFDYTRSNVDISSKDEHISQINLHNYESFMKLENAKKEIFEINNIESI